MAKDSQYPSPSLHLSLKKQNDIHKGWKWKTRVMHQLKNIINYGQVLDRYMLRKNGHRVAGTRVPQTDKTPSSEFDGRTNRSKAEGRSERKCQKLEDESSAGESRQVEGGLSQSPNCPNFPPGCTTGVGGRGVCVCVEEGKEKKQQHQVLEN
ncbi:hypothetical protein RUM43_011820 [Polyplax serrata]|uniref:Uncharacterized protein n=1 Tax=Polyplax serrata TaxID=468196 RepID=A0AAN8PIZ8_POLSC